MRFDSEKIEEYHFHVYYIPETRDSAVTLRNALMQLKGVKIQVYSLSDGPRGPHVSAMFGVDVPRGDVPMVLGFLMVNHGTHSVLLHPTTDNALLDHTEHAFWLGKPTTLDLSKV